MAAAAERPLRVVVCGTGFGRFYLRALRSRDPEFQLVGIVARGSAFSADCAREHGVPLYTDVEQLPADVDIACVVVRAGVAGGSGAELAQALLARGIHVLQEHSLHPDELAACVRAARRHGVYYHLNTFYPHVEPVRRFLGAARAMSAHQPPLFVDAVCASQVLHSTADIIGAAVGGLRPWTWEPPAPSRGVPFRSVAGVLAGVPVQLRVQHQVDPGNPDNHAHLLHRVSIGCEGGVLTLADTHGPVLWSPRIHAEKGPEGRLVVDGAGTERLDAPSTRILGPTAYPTFREVFTRLWPQAVIDALRGLADVIGGRADSLAKTQRDLTTTQLWHEILTGLGPPDIIRPSEPRPLALPELLAGAERNERLPS
ncbi:Gfo/Idh/MocA family oxidoreductase [Nocardia stercoris]|uniref:Thiazolinyl imide reductase n=1 Tax=Nocardia stercoris TaxID=2483361 RepID=A0A3M2L0Y8_9NOCA|nr:Gfo/Idh/MocA family oxidoreductase [Nocardia stercoris]RMI28208.1 thiazolinyl imide reductase [Nocardia stercoris]